MIRLHYHPGNASLAPHLLLNEIGAPFELVYIDRERSAHKSPEYLKLNPNGLIPVLEDGAVVLYETAAILQHLADRHPAAGLAPPLGSAERAEFYKWTAWLGNTLQPALSMWFYPERWVDDGDPAAAAQVRRRALVKAHDGLAQIDARLAATGPWMLGPRFSAIDPYTFMLCRWTRGFAERPARAHPHIAPFLQRMLERPAVRRTLEAEALPEPWV